MSQQDDINYRQVAEAIEYVEHNYAVQPTRDEIALKIGLTPSYLEQLFVNWAGVSAKKILRYISMQHTKAIINNVPPTPLFGVDGNTPPFSDNTLPDLPISIERMIPKTSTNFANKHCINYSYRKSVFGNMVIASTQQGICYVGFGREKQIAYNALAQRFSAAYLIEKKDAIQENALRAYARKQHKINRIQLQVNGTDFQLKVWQALLKIPRGKLATYATIAAAIQQPGAARAVGTAVASNPVAFLIPCHRIVQSTGAAGQYRWGATRKKAIIAWEAAQGDPATTTD